MKPSILAPLILSTCLISPYVLACGDSPVMTSKMNGVKIGITIPDELILRTDGWSPGHGEPPLSLSEAYDLVRGWAEIKYARYDAVDISEISLRKHNCFDTNNRWYYVFDLVPMMDGNSFWGAGNWGVVLLGGTIIEPKEVQ